MAWSSGQRLYGDRYVIENLLGWGGFGVTYLARNQKGERVVIKTLRDEILEHRQFAWFRDKFKDEALQLSFCRHPHIVQVENFFFEKHLPCLVMEYVQGEDLQQLVKRRGALSETEALYYIRQIGEALSVVHSKGLLHRDVKPSNIMVRNSKSEAVLIDFGMARGFIPDFTHRHTQSYTQGFAPPEQYLDSARWGEFTDVYALAATLYYLLTKSIPTPAPQRALKALFYSPKQVNSSISEPVNQAILKGMELEATKRPQSVREWLGFFQDVGSVPTVESLPRNDLEGARGLELGAREDNAAPLSPPSPLSSTTIPQPLISPFKLNSELGVDFSKLRDLLAAGKWKEADEETLLVMLEVAEREKEGWLNLLAIEKFPRTDLCTIDALWGKYSKSRFGFSAQRRIWESVGGTPDANYETYCRFGDRIGWRQKNNWLGYSHLTFTLNAPVGYLPLVASPLPFLRVAREAGLGGCFGSWVWRVGVSLLSRQDL